MDNFKFSPNSLFIIDAIGALLSAFLLGVVLVQYQAVFGIPVHVLHILAVFPCLFAMYDVGCLIAKPTDIGAYLKGIAFMNMGYVVLSLSLAFIHHESLTLFGWMYLSGEVVIVTLVAMVELKAGFTSSIHS